VTFARVLKLGFRSLYERMVSYDGDSLFEDVLAPAIPDAINLIEPGVGVQIGARYHVIGVRSLEHTAMLDTDDEAQHQDTSPATISCDLASRPPRFLEPGELTMARGGFGGGISRENFTTNTFGGGIDRENFTTSTFGGGISREN
jgi:hypothetical protein